MFVRYNGKMFVDVLKEYKNSLFIYSLWDGYLTEKFRDKKIYNYVPKKENGEPDVVQLHTSGHAYEEDILKLCDIVKPEIIFPIHSEDTGRFEVLKEENPNIITGKIKRFEKSGDIEEI